MVAMLQVFLTEDPEIEYLFCDAPSDSETCLFFLFFCDYKMNILILTYLRKNQ